MIGEEMDNYTAVGIAEGFIECDDGTKVIEAWQHLIDTGQAWQLQGWFGRTAMYLINEGHCQMPPKTEDALKHVSQIVKKHEG